MIEWFRHEVNKLVNAPHFMNPDIQKLDKNAVCSVSRCALWLRYVDLVVKIEVAVEMYSCFTVFSC
jgi:hypothetical protein